MNTRTLGTQGLTVSELGLGCMGMSYAYGQADDGEAIQVIHRALELGVTFLDTAELYGPYTNEKLVGRAIQGRRDEVVIATKFGFDLSEDGQINGTNSRPEHVRDVCEASLRRLGIDHIDLFYQHRLDPDVPIEETVGEMSRLVEEGKVRYLGLSEAGSEALRRAHSTHPISALQTEYSLWERGVERAILPTLRELGIGFVPYSPLGRGFLTGQITKFEDLPEGDYRRTDPRYQGENFDQNMELVERIGEIADEKDATPAQIALAWLLHQGEDVVPIPGTKRIKYLEENVAAADVQLSGEDLERIEEIVPPGAVAGPRYSEDRMRVIDSE